MGNRLLIAAGYLGLVLGVAGLVACDKLPAKRGGNAASAGSDAVLQCSVDTYCMINRACDGGQCKLHKSGGVIDDAMTDMLPSMTARIYPVIKLPAPYKARNDDSGYGLTVTPSTGHSDRFLEGERIVVKLQQANYDGYLYVDYFSIDGNVVHVYPNSGEPGSGQLVAAHKQFEIGATELKSWTVAPPFGQELITVITSPTPLYEGTLVEVQNTYDYLPRLQQMLEANQGNLSLAANYLLIQTVPRTSALSGPAPMPAVADSNDAASRLQVNSLCIANHSRKAIERSSDAFSALRATKTGIDQDIRNINGCFGTTPDSLRGQAWGPALAAPMAVAVCNAWRAVHWRGTAA